MLPCAKTPPNADNVATGSKMFGDVESRAAPMIVICNVGACHTETDTCVVTGSPLSAGARA